MLAPAFPVSLADLAPGDRTTSLDPAALQWHRIRSVDDPLFEEAYRRLWAEFSPSDSMERREVLAERFRLAPAMLYELVLVRAEERFAAVRDHTVIAGPEGGTIVVHLSHNLVDPAWRRSGLAGWLRALPLAAARECAAALGLPASTPITLVAEMDYAAPDDPQSTIRLRAYEKAGFLKADPQVVRYHQPDFRAPAEIDAAGGAEPIPYQLLLRRVGREGERSVSGAELRQIVAALYRMYGAQCRPRDMAHPALRLESLPADAARVALLEPSAAP